MSISPAAFVFASLTVCVLATEGTITSSSATALLARDHLSPLQWGKRVNRVLGLRGHKNHASALSRSSSRSHLELDVPIESIVETSLEDAGIFSNRAAAIVAKKSEEIKSPEGPSAGGAQVVMASPNPLVAESGPTASPNPLAEESTVFRPTASPNPLAEAFAPSGPTARPNVLAGDASAPSGPTASPNVLAGDASAPSGPTASPNVLAGDIIVDKSNGAPVATPMGTPVLAAASTPVAASPASLVTIPNLKSLDSLFGSARAASAASIEPTAAPGVALAAVAPAVVTPVVVAPAAVVPVSSPMVTPTGIPPSVVQASAPQPVTQPSAPSLPPLAAVSLTKPVVNRVLKLGLKGMAATGGEFTLKVMNQMSEKLRHTPGADVVQYLDELGGLQRGPVGARNTFWISLARNPCDWYVQLWANYQAADRQALNNRYGGAFFSAGNQDQLKFENWLNWALGDHDNILPDSNGIMSLRYSDTVVLGKPVDWIYNRQHMKDYNGQLLNAYALSRNGDSSVETELQSFSPKSKVDCWIMVEHYVESLRNCLSQYEAMAHVELDWEPFDLLIDKPHKTSGDSVVDRDQCSAYYTSELAEKVQHRDRHLFEVFGYDTCCGAPTRPIE